MMAISQAYPQTSDISGSFVGNKIVDHWDVVGAAALLNSIFILDLKPGFNKLRK